MQGFIIYGGNVKFLIGKHIWDFRNFLRLGKTKTISPTVSGILESLRMNGQRYLILSICWMWTYATSAMAQQKRYSLTDCLIRLATVIILDGDDGLLMMLNLGITDHLKAIINHQIEQRSELWWQH